MKTGKLLKHLHRVFILIILIGVVAVSTSLTVDSPELMKEYRTGEVLLVIDEKLGAFVSADESDRGHKVNLFKALTDFQTQICDQNIQIDRVDSEFDVVFNQIVDWFYSSYVSMVDEIAEEAAGDISEVLQYLSELSSDIDRLSEDFINEDFDSAGIDDYDERTYRAELFAELSSMYELFIIEEFIPQRLDANEERINELTEVLSLIENERIIDSERIAGLSNMIISLVEEFAKTDQTAATEASSIVHRFEAELSLKRAWFEEHYFSLIDVIVNMDREDEFDNATVKNQIEKLSLVTQFIEDDAVVSFDVFLLVNEQIEQLIEEYEEELVAIEERIKQRDIAAANAAAAAAAANRRAAAAAVSNTSSRTSSNNNSTNGNNSSSNNNNTNGGNSSPNNNTSGNSSNSNSNNTSESTPDSTSARTNNNYPSISSNCREMLARLVRLEAPNEGADGKQAVAEVVLNRMVSSRWSHANTVEEVIFDDRWGVQFTVKDRIWTDRGNPSSADYAAVDRALGGSNILSRSYVFFNSRPVTQNDVIWIGSHAFSK